MTVSTASTHVVEHVAGLAAAAHGHADAAAVHHAVALLTLGRRRLLRHEARHHVHELLLRRRASAQLKSEQEFIGCEGPVLMCVCVSV